VVRDHRGSIVPGPTTSSVARARARAQPGAGAGAGAASGCPSGVAKVTAAVLFFRAVTYLLPIPLEHALWTLPGSHQRRTRPKQ
jgi:hypothetical protein